MLEHDDVGVVLVGRPRQRVVAGIPDATRIHDRVAAFGARRTTLRIAVGTGNRLRPWLAVTEAGRVVLRELHGSRGRRLAIDDRRAKCVQARDDAASGSDLGGFIEAHPVLVRQVHEAAHTGIERCNRGWRADGVDVDLHALLGAFVDDGLDHFDLGLGRGGFGRQRDLSRVLDALGGHRTDGCTSLVGGAAQVHALGRNDARTVDQAGIDVVTQRDVAVTRTTA